MCGMSAPLTQPNGRGLVSDDKALVEMRDRMSHRGPDGGGLWRSPAEDCVLGHRRLSIIDRRQRRTSRWYRPTAKSGSSSMAKYTIMRTFAPNWSGSANTRLGPTIPTPRRCCMRSSSGGRLAFSGLRNVRVRDLRRARSGAAGAASRARPHGIKPLYFARTDAGESIFASEIKALLAHPAIAPR